VERLPWTGRLLWWGGLLLAEVAAGLSILILPDPLYGFLLTLLIPLGLLLWKKPLLGYLLMIFFLPNYGIDLMKISETADLSLLGAGTICSTSPAYLIEPGHFDREVCLRFARPEGVVAVTDVISGKKLEITDKCVKMTILAGAFRILEVRLKGQA